MRLELLVPVAIAMCVVAAIKILESYRLRRRIVDAQTGQETVRALLEDERLDRQLASLKWTLHFAALSGAFGVIAWLQLDATEPATISLLLGALAVSQLAFYVLDTRRSGK